MKYKFYVVYNNVSLTISFLAEWINPMREYRLFSIAIYIYIYICLSLYSKTYLLLLRSFAKSSLNTERFYEVNQQVK